ncbi:MAG: hypothetical protein L3J07_03670 [Candidatus Magasanikbacteria bacterium]|nr:hypothetical protein [Candidatus Magasanikbacteria bacterium]
MNKNVVKISDHRKMSGRFYSVVPAFKSPDLNAKLLKFPNYWRLEIMIVIDYIRFDRKVKTLCINIENKEYNFSKLNESLMRFSLRKISISSLLGCNRFEGDVKLTEHITGDRTSFFMYDVKNTDFDFEVVFYEGSRVTFICEGRGEF